MLVLTRRLGEAITIGENIKIVIVDLDASQVKIGIEAPRSVEVYREELYIKIKGRSFSSGPGDNKETDEK
jgi:carbon storage regulator